MDSTETMTNFMKEDGFCPPPISKSFVIKNNRSDNMTIIESVDQIDAVGDKETVSNMYSNKIKY